MRLLFVLGTSSGARGGDVAAGECICIRMCGRHGERGLSQHTACHVCVHVYCVNQYLQYQVLRPDAHEHRGSTAPAAQ